MFQNKKETKAEALECNGAYWKHYICMLFSLQIKSYRANVFVDYFDSFRLHMIKVDVVYLLLHFWPFVIAARS